MAEKTLPKYLTISQAAEYLNTTPNTLRVEYYCQQYGIDFKDVNPAYTSQYCPNCGQHFTVRFGKHNEKTLCPNCGEMDCNIAASKNILARATDKEITLYTPYKKVKAILDQRIAS